MSIVDPIPEPTLSFPMRGDFAVESGYESALRTAMLPRADGLARGLERIIPPNLSAAEYRQISRWARFPSRVAYFERRGANGYSLVAILVPWFSMEVSRTRLWDELVMTASEHLKFGRSLPWRCGVRQTVPQHVILHDADTSTAYLTEYSQLGRLLFPSIQWNVPAAIARAS